MQEKTIEVLIKAGWYPNRKIDISELLIHYERKGFDMFPAAKKFIEEYGMLNIYIEKSRPGVSDEYVERYKLEKFTLHTTDMTKFIITGLASRSNVEKYEQYIEEKLVLVGSLTDHHQDLMISESGRMFTEFGFWGNSAEEFWDRLIDGVGCTNWEAWDGW